jgi:hypothetical protein
MNAIYTENVTGSAILLFRISTLCKSSPRLPRIPPLSFFSHAYILQGPPRAYGKSWFTVRGTSFVRLDASGFPLSCRLHPPLLHKESATILR